MPHESSRQTFTMPPVSLEAIPFAHICVSVCAGLHLSNQRERGLHERAARSGMSIACRMTWITLPMSHPETGTLEMVQWPFLLPHDMVSWMEYICFLVEVLSGFYFFNGDLPIVMSVG